MVSIIPKEVLRGCLGYFHGDLQIQTCKIEMAAAGTHEQVPEQKDWMELTTGHLSHLVKQKQTYLRPLVSASIWPM